MSIVYYILEVKHIIDLVNTVAQKQKQKYLWLILIEMGRREQEENFIAATL